MKRKISRLLCAIFLTFNALIITSCENRDETVNCFPDVPINFSFSIYEPLFISLQNIGGYVETPNFEGAGTNGLIIFRKNANTLLVFDRNSPHICPESNTVLRVESGTVVCPKDGAKWFLQDGGPINDETLGIPLKMYRSTIDGAGNVSIRY